MKRISELIEKIRTFFRKRKQSLDEKRRDIALMSYIAPSGGISFREDRLNRTGEGYSVCLHVTGYPSSVDPYWAVPLTGMASGIVTMDIHTPSQKDVMDNINRSIWNQHNLNFEERDVSQRSIRDYDRGQFEKLLKELESQEETVKYMHLRIYLTEETEERLDSLVASVRERLRSIHYDSYVMVGENKLEYRALSTPYSHQYDDVGEALKRSGQPVTASALADSYPFHFTHLKDRYGSFLGMTELNGPVIFDQFEKTDRRTSYDICILGKKGSGKSTLMKKLADNAVARGDIVFGIDPSGESRTYVKERGGAYITLDGTEGTVNPLEILSTADTEALSYQRHLSGFRTFYEFLKKAGDQDVDISELMEAENLVGMLYEKMGFPMDGRYTGFSPEEYPVLTDLLELTENELYSDVGKKIVREELTQKNAERLEDIIITLRNAVNSYGDIFDRHTSFRDITGEDLVFFDLSNVMRLNVSVSSAVLFNALKLCWERCLATGRKMLEAYNKREIPFEDVKRCLIVIDEAHNIINTEQKGAVREIHRMIMEDRKYFTGIIYASPSVSSFIRNDTDNETRDLIVSLFRETQYRFLLREDQASLPMLRNVFGRSVPELYLNAMTGFSKGEAILNISGEGSLRLKIHLSDRDERIYGGGA